MKERIIKNWITSVIGLAIILAGVIIFILSKINRWDFSGWELIPVVLLGYLLFMAKDNFIKNLSRLILSRGGTNQPENEN